MHAAGATGAAVVISDCSSVSAVPLYGASCVDACIYQAPDAGMDASDGASNDARAAETSVDASEDAPDAGAEDASDGG
jgi:hypothetical protein